MTTDLFSSAFIAIINDLSQQLSAEERYKRLLQTLRQLFPGDACALLKLEQDALIALAIDGLTDETLGRRFLLAEQPRLAAILAGDGIVRFAADSPLPDPYDGLVKNSDNHFHIHDCMGVALKIDGETWGILTFDALTPGTFDKVDYQALQTFIGLTETSVKAAERIVSLEAQIKQAHGSLVNESNRLERIGRNQFGSAQKAQSETTAEPTEQQITFKQQVDDFARQLIRQKLEENKDNMAKTAQAFGLDRGNFFRLLKRLEIK